MSVYLITYDLNAPGKNYDKIFEAIKEASVGGNTWWHHLDSTWFIKSNLSVQQVSDKIKTHVDGNDFYIVIEVINNKQGWLPQKAWDYLNDVIFK